MPSASCIGASQKSLWVPCDKLTLIVSSITFAAGLVFGLDRTQGVTPQVPAAVNGSLQIGVRP
jgi:hypothetical protein